MLRICPFILLSAPCRVINKLIFVDGRLQKKDDSTMGKGKEPPLSWINVTRKKVVILGQALKNSFPVLEFLGLNNPIF